MNSPEPAQRRAVGSKRSAAFIVGQFVMERRTPAFAHDGICAIANPHKGKAKITFGHGAELPDPYGLFNAGLGGKKWRAIDLFDGDRLNKTAFKQLVRAAVKETVARAKAKEGTKGKA